MESAIKRVAANDHKGAEPTERPGTPGGVIVVDGEQGIRD